MAELGSIVTGNIVQNNNGDGIRTLGSTVSGNTARGNTGDGINVTCPASITGNTSNANTGMNLVTSGVCNPDADHNDAP